MKLVEISIEHYDGDYYVCAQTPAGNYVKVHAGNHLPSIKEALCNAVESAIRGMGDCIEFIYKVDGGGEDDD